MNKNWIVFHLREGLEELIGTIAAIESKPDYDEIEFEIAMAHLYNHLNTAWNSRNATPDQTAECSDEDFYAWTREQAALLVGNPREIQRPARLFREVRDHEGREPGV